MEEDEKSPHEFLKAIAREKNKPKTTPPIYTRNLPPLPAPPKYAESWPMPPVPKPKARPPESEAYAPPIRPVPMPSPKSIPEARPLARPVVIRPLASSNNANHILELGKLNPFIADETITMIQCDGANMPLKIVKERRTEEIDILLSEEEIKSVIKAFANASSQPITEPLFRTSYKGIIFSAVISAFAGSRFTITR